MGKYLLKKLFYSKKLLAFYIAFSLLSIFFTSTTYAQNRIMLADDENSTATAYATLTPYPTYTPTLTPTPIPTTDTTPTPTPTTTPIPVPTNIPPTLPIPTPTPMPIVDDTPTPTLTPTPTPTVLPIAPTPPTNDPSSQQDSPKSGDPGTNTASNGFAKIAPMIGISLLLSLVIGSLFYLLYQRSHKQQLILQHNIAIPALAQNAQWIRDSNAILAQSPNTFAAATPAPTPTPLTPANTTTFHDALTIQQPTPFVPSTDTQEPNYAPSNPQPTPMPFPPHIHSDVTYTQTSDMSALPLDILDSPDHNGSIPSPMHDHSIPTLSSPMLPATTQSVQPPDVTQDVTLYNVMQQAQLGIFIIPQHVNTSDTQVQGT